MRTYLTSNPNIRDWQVWGDTSVSAPSAEVYTRAEGHDRCGSNPYSYRMGIEHIDTNTTYGTSTVAQGTYQNCLTGAHGYRVTSWHYRKKWSTSSWEGSWGYTYY